MLVVSHGCETSGRSVSTSLMLSEPFGDLLLVCRVVLFHTAGG